MPIVGVGCTVMVTIGFELNVQLLFEGVKMVQLVVTEGDMVTKEPVMFPGIQVKELDPCALKDAVWPLQIFGAEIVQLIGEGILQAMRLSPQLELPLPKTKPL